MLWAKDIVFNWIGKLYIFETSVGVKHFGGGPIDLSKYCMRTLGFLSLGCDVDDFVLNPHFLKDEYSLAGTPISESPHYSLMDAIAQGRDISQTEYVKRRRQGILDSRLPRRISSRTLLAKYHTKMTELESGIMGIVYVVPVQSHGAKFFVTVDGKHRLAMCAYHHQYTNLHIAMLRHDLYNVPKFRALYQRCRETPSLYTKNLKLLDSIYDTD